MANSIVKIGPPGGPFVEIDEVDGNTVFRVPNDQIDFENVDFTNVANALLSGENFDGQGTSSLTNLAAVETETQSIGQLVGRISLTTDQIISNNTITQIDFDQTEVEDAVVTADLANSKITITTDGTYLVLFNSRWRGSANWTQGDVIESRVRDDTNATDLQIPINAHLGVDKFISNDPAMAVVKVTGNTDIIGQVRHESGGDESIQGAATVVNLSVMRLG